MKAPDCPPVSSTAGYHHTTYQQTIYLAEQFLYKKQLWLQLQKPCSLAYWQEVADDTGKQTTKCVKPL